MTGGLRGTGSRLTFAVLFCVATVFVPKPTKRPISAAIAVPTSRIGWLSLRPPRCAKGIKKLR